MAFLFSDNHIVEESFVEDINSILNSGEITGLFPQDERDRLMSDFRPYAEERGAGETRDTMWRAFVGRVRDNLHLVLAMSPVGEAFRARCEGAHASAACCPAVGGLSPHQQCGCFTT